MSHATTVLEPVISVAPPTLLAPLADDADHQPLAGAGGCGSRPVNRIFTAMLLYPCDCCHQAGTTAVGALWRTGEGDALYYLHSRCLASYKALHGLRSVEGRVARTAIGAAL